MRKAYWIGHVDVHDAAEYEAYRQANAAAFAKYGGTFIIRGGDQQLVEGQQRSHAVVIEFADLATARACYDSPEYQAAKALRLPCSLCDLVIVAGVEP